MQFLSIKFFTAIFIAIMIFLLYQIFFHFSFEENRDKGIYFNSSQINGVLTSCKGDKTGTVIKINSSNEKFWFLPLLNDEEKRREFCDMVRIGDKIIKNREDSIMYVINVNDTLEFTFVRYTNEGRILPFNRGFISAGETTVVAPAGATSD